MRRLSFILILLLSSFPGVLAAQKHTSSDSAKSYIDRGNELYAKGFVDRAIADYNSALVFDPTSSFDNGG